MCQGTIEGLRECLGVLRTKRLCPATLKPHSPHFFGAVSSNQVAMHVIGSVKRSPRVNRDSPTLHNFRSQRNVLGDDDVTGGDKLQNLHIRHVKALRNELNRNVRGRWQDDPVVCQKYSFNLTTISSFRNDIFDRNWAGIGINPNTDIHELFTQNSFITGYLQKQLKDNGVLPHF
jgi:hypothetical protein